jgi:hypothetical protein
MNSTGFDHVVVEFDVRRRLPGAFGILPNAFFGGVRVRWRGIR